MLYHNAMRPNQANQANNCVEIVILLADVEDLLVSGIQFYLSQISSNKIMQFTISLVLFICYIVVGYTVSCENNPKQATSLAYKDVSFPCLCVHYPSYVGASWFLV